MIRIFIVGYSQNKGGVESYIDNLSSMMDKSKYEIVYSMPEMTINGKKWIRPRNRHNYLKYYRFWKKFYKENRFDVLYYNTCDVVSIDQLRFAKSAGVPVRIIHSHNSGNQQELSKRLSVFHRCSEKINRKVLHKYATTFFACSEKAGEWMFDGREYAVVNNGVDLQKFKFDEVSRDRIREELGIGSAPLVGCIGRIAPQKNPLFTVEVALELVKYNPLTKVVFIGDGELRSEVEENVRKYKIQDNIIFTGPIDNVNEWLSALDCVLMPSLFEGLPFVLVEAQAVGVPCVVSTEVSKEANITGIVNYLSLDDTKEKWATKILDVIGNATPLVERLHMLNEAGYSIENTANQVSYIIDKEMKEHTAID